MTTSPILAALDRFPSLSENLVFILTGFIFVILVLACLSVATSLIGAAIKRTEGQPPAATATPASTPPPAPEAEEAPLEEDVVPAIIAAAVHMAMGRRPHRIVSIQRKPTNWAAEGRRDIFSSHRVR